jgi:hypothetical protein
MIRINSRTLQQLKQMESVTGRSPQDLLQEAVQELRRKLYLEGLNADYAALRRNAKAAKDFEQELSMWDVTNDDGRW